MDGGYMVVGAYNNSRDSYGNIITALGAAYIYKQTPTGQWRFIQKITPKYHSSNIRNFGSAVAIKGNTIVIGAPHYNFPGAAFVYTKIPNSDYWIEKQVLKAALTTPGDEFGNNVAVDGSFIVVGAYKRNTSQGTRAGVAVVFARQADGTWLENQTLAANDAMNLDQFGTTVSIFDSTIVVGVPQQSTDENSMNGLVNTGAAYIFQCQSNGSWLQVQKIVADQRRAYDNFASDVAIHANTIVCGAKQNDYDIFDANFINGAGAAYIFEKQNNSWVRIQKIVADDRSNQSIFFGSAVAIDNNLLVVGAVNEPKDVNGINTITNAGAIYLYERQLNGTWIPLQKKITRDRRSNDNIGNTYSVAISGYDVVASTSEQDYDFANANYMQSAGALYTFKAGTITQFDTLHICYGNTASLPDGWLVTGAGDYSTVFSAAIGCSDSIISTHVIVDSSNYFYNPVSVCRNLTYTLPNGQVVSSSGNYVIRIPVTGTCDSIIETQLNFYTIRHTDSLYFCAGDTLILPNGLAVTNQGLYSDTLQLLGGCDSIQAYRVISRPSYNQFYTISICPGDTFTTAGGRILSSAGTYRDTLQSIYGCDSILTYYLPPLLSANTSLFASITCNGASDGAIEVISQNGIAPITYSFDAGATFGVGRFSIGLAAGIYETHVRDNNGCTVILMDTIIEPPILLGNVVNTVDVSCYGTTDGSISISAAGGTTPYTYSFDNGNTFSNDSSMANLAAGIYQLQIMDTNSCLVAFSDTIASPPSIDTMLLLSGDTIYTNEVVQNYQWYDCITGQAITAASLPYYIPTANGSYALILSNSAICVDTSSCINWQFVGNSLTKDAENQIIIYPNPVGDQLNIAFNQAPLNLELSIYNALGQEIQKHDYSNSSKVLSIDCQALVPANYWIVLKIESQFYSFIFQKK